MAIKKEETVPAVTPIKKEAVGGSFEDFIPEVNPGFIPFGVFNEIEDIVKSGLFYPTYVAGPTRCGKTEPVLQACAEAKRRVIRVNVTVETSEADLLGGHRLVDGSTVWEDGPVVRAMETGSILLLDEYDLGGSRMLILQPVMEGKGVYIKKINKMVKPIPGFNVFATANTKGKGSEDGRYIGTQVQNDAALERFAITLDADYPEKAIEVRILSSEFTKYDLNPSEYPNVAEFIEALATWSANLREAAKAGGSSEVITLGRLLYACKSYKIFTRNRLKSIRLAVNRFDINTQAMLLDAYKKVDPKAKDGPDEQKALLPHQIKKTKTGTTARAW
jgi:MoxR-like ATPase